MTSVVGWHDILLRLGLAVLAGVLIGFNRGEQGHPAGLRTTLLVCVAATVAMIEANILMGTTGDASALSINADVMRLPLGILSGMGFIGAGAILRRGKIVAGLTTAATLWIVTVIGLCFGGGQLGLGLSAMAIALATLWILKFVEGRMPTMRDATMTLTTGSGGPTAAEIAAELSRAGLTITTFSMSRLASSDRQRFTYAVRYCARDDDVLPPSAIDRLAARIDIADFSWRR